MKNIFKNLILAIGLLIFSSCHDDLNQSPIDPDSFTEENVFATVNDAKGALAKLYASLALTGQNEDAEPDLKYFEKIIEEAFQKADRDQSGYVSFEEFIIWARSNRDIMVMIYIIS